jgi:hypothetical protein
MDLTKRCGGKCPFVELGENVFRIVTEFVEYHFAQQRPMHRRSVKVERFQRLHEFFRGDVREIRERLTDLHHGAAQVTHRIQHADRRSPMSLRQHPVIRIHRREPSANPIEQVRGRDFRLQGTEQRQSSPAPDWHRSGRFVLQRDGQRAPSFQFRVNVW